MSGEQPDSTDLLNPNQRNSLATTLSVLEEMLYEIELNISYGPCRWVMYEMNDDLPTPVKEEIVQRIALIRERIRAMMEEFALEKRSKRVSGDVKGKLSYAWEILEGAKARYLRGYGAVAEGLSEHLDPQLNAVIVLVDGILKLISRKERAPEGDRQA
jgi:hypothetical protein